MNFCTGKIVLFLFQRQSGTSRRTSRYVRIVPFVLCYNMILLFARWCNIYQQNKGEKDYKDWISAQERLCCFWSIVKAILVEEPVPVPFSMYNTVCIYVTIWYCCLFVDVTCINEKSYSDTRRNEKIIWRIEFLHRKDFVTCGQLLQQ